MKKETKQISAGKKLCILFFIITLLFAIINIAWLVCVHLPYTHYCSKLEFFEEDGEKYYSTVVDDYLYSVRKPGYMDFTGLLIIGDKDGSWISYDNEGNVIGTSDLYIELNIIPDIWGNYTYRLWFNDEISGLDTFVYIDDNFKYIPSETASEETINKKTMLVSDNLEEIQQLVFAAKDFWELT